MKILYLSELGTLCYLLWGCFIGERLMVRDAHAQRAHLMRELQQMQRERRTEPVSAPAPAGPQPVRVTLG